jgi:hypothetical protein
LQLVKLHHFFGGGRQAHERTTQRSGPLETQFCIELTKFTSNPFRPAVLEGRKVLPSQIFRCVTNVVKELQKTWRDSAIQLNGHWPKMNALLPTSIRHRQIVPSISLPLRSPGISALEFLRPPCSYARPGSTQIFLSSGQSGPPGVNRRGCEINGVVHLQNPLEGPVSYVQITRPSGGLSREQISGLSLNCQTSRQAHFFKQVPNVVMEPHESIVFVAGS